MAQFIELDTHWGKTLLNIDRITRIRPSPEGCNIGVTEGYSFDIEQSYDEVKKLIENATTQ